MNVGNMYELMYSLFDSPLRLTVSTSLRLV